jgi:hypothetical protein
VEDLYKKVSVGDVGYVYTGLFYRIFNVTVPWGDLPNLKFGASKPENYEPMKKEEFKQMSNSRLAKGYYSSLNVTSQKNTNNVYVQDPRE